MNDHVRTESAEGVLELTMARPEKKNALTNAMYGALADGIEAARADRSVRAVLIRGEGDMFTAGNDLGEFAAGLVGEGGQAELGVTRFLRAIATTDIPLVAAVQGRAVGVGTTMLLHCDYVVLAAGTSLTAPFASLGLVPEAASSLLLPARIGHARAFAMLAMGDAASAQEALDWGIANQVVPDADLDAAGRQAARRIAALPPGAIAATKRLMRESELILARIGVEADEFIARLRSPEAREAFAAFAQRRAPDFSRFV